MIRFDKDKAIAGYPVMTREGVEIVDLHYSDPFQHTRDLQMKPLKKKLFIAIDIKPEIMNNDKPPFHYVSFAYETPELVKSEIDKLSHRVIQIVEVEIDR